MIRLEVSYNRRRTHPLRPAGRAAKKARAQDRVKRHKQAKARTVAHHHKHVKPAHAHHKAATGHHHKHHKAHKHHHVAKKHKGMVHRGLALGDAVACCAAEALAASLRLSGIPVTDADVLALHRLSGADDDAGGPIQAVLEAASGFGLAGVRLYDAAELVGEAVQPLRGDVEQPAWHPEAAHIAMPASRPEGLPVHRASLILGVDLPGPHTVLATPDGWWSWGELHCPWCDFPDAVIEEAWEVAWLS